MCCYSCLNHVAEGCCCCESLKVKHFMNPHFYSGHCEWVWQSTCSIAAIGGSMSRDKWRPPWEIQAGIEAFHCDLCDSSDHCIYQHSYGCRASFTFFFAFCKDWNKIIFQKWLSILTEESHLCVFYLYLFWGWRAGIMSHNHFQCILQKKWNRAQTVYKVMYPKHNASVLPVYIHTQPPTWVSTIWLELALF